MMHLYDYLQSSDVPVDKETVVRILARQETAFSARTPHVSGLQYIIPHEREDLLALYDQVKPSEVKDRLVKYSNKIIDKWWGLQGRTLGKSFNELFAPYEAKREVDYDFLREDEEYVREYRRVIRPLIDYLKELLATKGTIFNSPREAYALQLKAPKSSSGFLGFTTEESRSAHLLKLAAAQADALLTQHWKQEPFLVWYRDMRQKFRLIFASSLSHMVLYRRLLHPLLTTGVGKIPQVFYHSEIEESRRQREFFFAKRKKRNVSRGAACGDYEQMDAHVSLKLGQEVIRETLQLAEVPDDQVAIALEALAQFFTAPLVDFHGYVHFGTWNLLSGMGPTNGLENLINLRVQTAAVVEARRKCKFPPQIRVEVEYSVMGDDSALLVAVSAPRSVSMDEVRLFRDEFMQAFVNEFRAISARLSLETNKDKQEVATEEGERVFGYCRSLYPIGEQTLFKRIDDGTPIPIYPLEFALNNSIRPENAPRYDFPSYLREDVSSSEIANFFARLDRCYGDPRFEQYLNALARVTCQSDRDARRIRPGVFSLVFDAYAAVLPPASWRTKLYGAERWSASSSPTVAYLQKSCPNANYIKMLDWFICDKVAHGVKLEFEDLLSQIQR